MTVRLMHLADLHLGAPLSYLGDKATQRSTELESAFVRAIDLAPERNIHAVVIAGDLFNLPDPPGELIARVKAALQKAAAAGIATILIPGTHDSHRYARSVYRRTEFPGADILLETGRPLRKKLGGHEVYFYGFSGGRNTGAGAPPFGRGPGEGLHIALVHGPVSEGTHWTPSPRDYPLSPDELEQSGFHYVALGHYHDFKEYRRGDTTAVYPGTLEGLKFGENGERNLLIAEVDGEGVTLERIRHNCRTLCELRIDLVESNINFTDDLIAEIEGRADSDAIVRITLTGATDFIPAAGEIRARAASSFFHLEISDQTSVVEGGLIHSIAREETVRGIFARKMLERIEHAAAENRATAELALRAGIEQFMRMRDENN